MQPDTMKPAAMKREGSLQYMPSPQRRGRKGPFESVEYMRASGELVL